MPGCGEMLVKVPAFKEQKIKEKNAKCLGLKEYLVFKLVSCHLFDFECLGWAILMC